MRQCLALGRKSMELGNAPVGSLLLLDGEVIGKGLELGHSKNDITYHAEIEAIRDALSKTGKRKLSGTTLYTTHEPCLMCTYAIRHYGIHRVVYGLATGAIGGQSSKYGFLQAEDIGAWTKPPQVTSGVLADECQVLHSEFLSRKRK